MVKTMKKNNKNDNDYTVVLLCEYLSTKENNYNDEIVYFKVIDNDFKSKVKPLNSSKFLVPLFKTDKDIILKMKSKHVKSMFTDMIKKELYEVLVEFKYYEYQPEGRDLIKGYYATTEKIIEYKPLMKLESEDESDN